MELTKEYFDKQLNSLATKDDLKDLATKIDLATIEERLGTFATREYLDQRLTDFATKDDLLELATKSHFETIRSDIAEVKSIVTTLQVTHDEDTRAAFRDIAELQKRVSILERSISHK